MQGVSIMSDNSITPISSISSASLTPVSGALPKAQVKAPVNESSDHEKPPKQIENEPQQVSSSTNISVNFRVNEDNELVAFIVDRNSHRVLRSIPISEFYKMPAGELLKLAA
jgi:uncharacterized FlaG/YvyC family protein